MTPDPNRLLSIGNIEYPLIGLYDAPDPEPFGPLVTPKPEINICIFAFFTQWRNGKTLHITRDNYGCGGAGRAVCGVQARSREEFIKFLVDGEGLRASRELMSEWIDHSPTYQQTHPHILIGPLQPPQYEYLKTVTFFVNPDQFSLLVYGVHYHSRPEDPTPLVARFGSGCMQLVTVFDDLNIAQAAVGATDIAMRQYLPADVLAMTVTKAMYERLCSLDERSFLYKPFWKKLRQARGES